MFFKIKISIIIFIVAFVFSGCSFFRGQYQPMSRADNLDKQNNYSFEEANKMIERRLDDIASGRANMGEYDSEHNQINEDQYMHQNNDNDSVGPQAVIDPSKKYSAVLHTEEGNVVIELFADRTPFTVNNFAYLSVTNFYNNTIFHRVINGFMIQGGDPKGDGTGGPGYQFADEPFEGEYSRGTVAMANSGPNTNGSQFFIMHADYPLPKNYVIFGRVISGMETIDRIAKAPVIASLSGETSEPVKPIKILKVDIIEE